MGCVKSEYLRFFQMELAIPQTTRFIMGRYSEYPPRYDCDLTMQSLGDDLDRCIEHDLKDILERNPTWVYEISECGELYKFYILRRKPL